ncbi:Arylsulfatase precursor [Planctomycetes bacterium Pan216]|uniref:Arylsulfatase n=2 Tax=Kolteria novifilia TaxID=2527975 RepID=A0A518AZQ3_9BACT|nr:Arylsulfatase precursor [Planctomycetes bacterium Pan216]
MPAGGWAAAKRTKPNIVVIFADDLGYGEIGSQREDAIPTPNIDRLAREGIRCPQGYVTASYCGPSRAGMLTGRYQTRFGHELNPTGRHNLDPNAGLQDSEITLAERLKSVGYATGLMGKWHLGGSEEAHPRRRGFDDFYGFLHEGHYYVPPPYRNVTSFLRRRQLPTGMEGRWREGETIWSSHLPHDEPPYDDHNPVMRDTTPIVEQRYLTQAISDEAVEFIGRHRDEPFFLYVAYSAVHSPMQGRREVMKRFSLIEDVHRRVFAAMLADLDKGVGEIMHKLHKEGLDERTLIFFISDNGGPTAELTSSNEPFRGGKGTLYEGGIRVPYIVSWVGTLPAGKTYDEPVLATDVFATACSVAGTFMPIDRTMDSVNLIPFLLGKREGSPHPVLYWRMGKKTALREGDWKIVRHPVKGQAEPPFQLFHLSEDQGETNDLAKRRPHQLRALTELWQNLDREMVEPIWKPANRR